MSADAGPEMAARLLILDPPGDSLGLPFGGGETLRVRYETDDGEAIAGAEIAFAFVVGATEATGGAALSDTVATTGDDGIAILDLVAGPERSNFRVRATAARAPSATFYVTVSDAGFTDVVARPVHDGWRSADEFAKVQLRLFRRDFVTCEHIDIDEPPESVFAPRTLNGFGDGAAFTNLAALEAYTILAWGELEPGGARVAVGCVSLGASQVAPGPPVQVDAPVIDRPLALPARAELASHIDLTPVSDAVRAAGAAGPWELFACPAGPGQLLLDCALDAAVTVDGDATDCALDPLAAADPLVDAIEAQRAPLGTDGCRPASGLDASVTDAIATGGLWPTDAALGQLLAARDAVAAGVELGSELTPLSGGLARHRLLTARFDAAPGTYTIDLAATARPIIAAPVAIELDGAALALADHGFTLRLGRASRAAFITLGLEPRGIGERADELGTALAESVDTGSATGCAGFSALVCAAASQPTDCLHDACGEAAAALDDRLEDWWRTVDTAGLDLALAGVAPLHDFDDDLQVDSVGADNGGIAEGTWTVRVRLADGTEVPATGTFGARGPE